MELVAPKFNLDAFNCPTCAAYAHMRWENLGSNFSRRKSIYYEVLCAKCNNGSLWVLPLIKDHPAPSRHDLINAKIDEQAELIYPESGGFALPAEDMPADVMVDYVEASKIFSRSPRGAAALLRLGLQKLCKHLGEPGKNIYEDIRSLFAKEILPSIVINAADTLRIVGNNAVHPGEMSDDDFDCLSSKMFVLLNFIVKKAITEPKELQDFYKKIPEGPRKKAEERDAKAKSAKD